MVFVGASEPQHMSYMVRLGLWGEGTEFENFQKFQEAIEQRYYMLKRFFFVLWKRLAN